MIDLPGYAHVYSGKVRDLYAPLDPDTGVPREDRLRVGFKDGLLRLSVGIEDVEDLQADLAQALQGG